MNIISNLKWRYATKKFDATKTLSKEQITTIKEAFNLTATSYGFQPIHLIIISDNKLREKLLASAYGQRQVVDASQLCVICAKTSITDTDIDNHFERVKQVRQLSDSNMLNSKNNLTTNLRSKQASKITSWTAKQAYIALGNLLTVCACESIDSCPMEGFIPQEFDEQLGLNNKNLTSVLLLPIGFRHKDDSNALIKKVRQPIDKNITEI